MMAHFQNKNKQTKKKSFTPHQQKIRTPHGTYVSIFPYCIVLILSNDIVSNMTASKAQHRSDMTLYRFLWSNGKLAVKPQLLLLSMFWCSINALYVPLLYSSQWLIVQGFCCPLSMAFHHVQFSRHQRLLDTWDLGLILQKVYELVIKKLWKFWLSSNKK